MVYGQVELNLEVYLCDMGCGVQVLPF